jgi:hypothetical protein
MQSIGVEWLFSVDHTFNNHSVMHVKKIRIRGEQSQSVLC